MVLRLPKPHEVHIVFSKLLGVDSEQAAAYLYGLGVSSGYIKDTATETIAWTGESAYGMLECTINLAKPEKDPRAIAADALIDLTGSTEVSSPAPLCDLCWKNEGFAGTPEHPAKPGLRIAPIMLGGETWGLQYSPYAYVPEHCIALSKEHRPMKIDAETFERLLDFVDAFPFYFVGSNADLPIVGGSILSHDHYQGGRHIFPLMNAPIERTVSLADSPGVSCGVVRWPASVLRLVSTDRAALASAARRILALWLTYDDELCAIRSSSNVVQDGPVTHIRHNALNPIARREGPCYIMDLVLRNNRTDDEHPWGIFHPGEPLHHIKKENIGLIEIMGLAILPPRLAVELPAVQRTLIAAAREGVSPNIVLGRLLEAPETRPHAVWAHNLFARRAAALIMVQDSEAGPPDAECSASPPSAPGCMLHPVIRQEIVCLFAEILEATGVFKRTEEGAAGWDTFIEHLETPC